MLKFLLYIFLIYVAYKIFRAFSQAKFIVKSYRDHGNQQNHEEEEKEEGKVTIKKNPADEAGFQKYKNKDGEYIDFEEVDD